MKSKINFQATGTTWQIDYEGQQAEDLAQAIKDRLADYEHTYSRFRPDSLLSRMAQSAITDTSDGTLKEYIFPEDSKYLFALYRDMYEATGGLVTPLIGQVISDAGYDADYSLKPKNDIQSAKKWDDVMSFEYPTLTLKESVRLDFGAIGKGYAIDIIGQILNGKGITEYTINAGGDILHHGGIPIRVGLEHPSDAHKVIGIAEIAGNKSICGSAGNRRAWGEFHHIINPDTVISPKHISAVWVVIDGDKVNGGLRQDGIEYKENEYSKRGEYSSTTALADALTTGLFFVEPSILSQRLKVGFEYFMVYADNTMKKSSGFPAEIF